MKGQDLVVSSLSLLILVDAEGDAEPKQRICYATVLEKIDVLDMMLIKGYSKHRMISLSLSTERNQ